jgi:hypothetical protein
MMARGAEFHGRGLYVVQHARAYLLILAPREFKCMGTAIDGSAEGSVIDHGGVRSVKGVGSPAACVRRSRNEIAPPQPMVVGVVGDVFHTCTE